MMNSSALRRMLWHGCDGVHCDEPQLNFKTDIDDVNPILVFQDFDDPTFMCSDMSGEKARPFEEIRMELLDSTQVSGPPLLREGMLSPSRKSSKEIPVLSPPGQSETVLATLLMRMSRRKRKPSAACSET